MIVDGVRIGDEVALVAREQRVDRCSVVLGRELEEDVAAGHDHDPEVARAALLLGLDEHAGRIDADVRLRERVEPHCVDQRLHELDELHVPAAHRRARQNGSPPLPLTSGQVLHTQRPRTSWENSVCCTSTSALGFGSGRGSIEDSCQ